MFKINGSTKSVGQLQVFSEEGKTLRLQKLALNEGTSVHTIDVKSLQRGKYFLRIVCSDKVAEVMAFEKM